MKNNDLYKIDERVLHILPDIDRRKKGPYALFECFQPIPCNPCYTVCKFGAVKPLDNINDLPQTYFDKCTGCGMCITVCPGLAVFVIDETYSETETMIKIPYEFFPLPVIGNIVDAVNRNGQIVGKAKIVNVVTYHNKTSVISFIVEDKLAHVVRGIHTVIKNNSMIKEEDMPVIETAEDSIVCRCEDVSEAELQSLIDNNQTTLNELKLTSRVSMGPCQGKTCIPLIMKILSDKKKCSINQLKGPRYRQPLKPVKLGKLAGYHEEEHM